MSDQRKKTWYVLYDNADWEEILRSTMLVCQRHYARHGKYDPTLLDIPPSQLPSLSTKKDSTRQTSTQQQPETAKKNKVAQTKSKKKTGAKRQVSKKKNVRKTTKKKEDTTARPKLKLHNTDDEIVATHENYSPKAPYSYKVQYEDRSHPK